MEFNVEAMTPGGDMNHGHMDHSRSGHVSETHAAMDHANMSHALGSDAEQIAGMLKLAFDRPEAPLTVEPVVISGDWAVAGWAQDSSGGRGLMKKDAQGWFVLMWSGTAFRDAGKLMAAGDPNHDARSIAAMLEEEEGKLGAAATALFDGFEGMVEVGRAGHHGHVQHKNPDFTFCMIRVSGWSICERHGGSSPGQKSRYQRRFLRCCPCLAEEPG